MNSPARDLLDRYHQAMINFSADQFADLYAVDAIHEFPFRNPGGVSRLAGREEIRRYYSGLWADPPVVLDRIDNVAVHEPSPTTIVNEWSGTGRHRASAASFALSGVIVLELRGDRIVACRDYMDTYGLLQQTGSS